MSGNERNQRTGEIEMRVMIGYFEWWMIKLEQILLLKELKPAILTVWIQVCVSMCVYLFVCTRVCICMLLLRKYYKFTLW